MAEQWITIQILADPSLDYLLRVALGLLLGGSLLLGHIAGEALVIWLARKFRIGTLHPRADVLES